ncbi:MAG: hypothetical protein Q9169_007200 [Polycauliona sp. 2 TL-2023]
MFTPVATEVDSNNAGASPEGQNRSSSLSDIGDRGDDQTAIESDPNDTEAETERLEDSPYKSRTTQNLVLTDPNPVYDAVGEISVREIVQSSNGAASSRATSIEDGQSADTLNRPKKRKRSSLEVDHLNDQKHLNDEKAEGQSISNDALKTNYLTSSSESSPQPADRSNAWNFSRESSHGEEQGSERDTMSLPEAVKVKAKRGKQKLGKASDTQTDRVYSRSADINRRSEPIPDGGTTDAKDDDVEMDDQGEYGGFDTINKDEEASTKKRSAMDSLNAIERLFASLREKLFDERLAKLDAELTMLAEPNVTHPELLGMNQVLEQRRDEKIQHENTLLKYKLGSLENKSKAEKAQVHGQYMQSVRDIRDWNLEQVNKEWYQIHKERLARENNVPEYMYQHPTRRSQQITHQTAYNKEVSLLSGISKYRGFPAAPELAGAKPNEIESDFEKMGVSNCCGDGTRLCITPLTPTAQIAVQQPSVARARQPPSLQASLSATAVLQRSKSVADEHFLEQNPWANPQHPAHLHRQASGISRTASPMIVSATQKRPVDSSIETGSTPVSAGAPSGPRSAVNTGSDRLDTETRSNKQRVHAESSRQPPLSTPSKDMPVPKEKQIGQGLGEAGQLPKTKAPPLPASERPQPLAAGRVPGQEINVRPYMPRQTFQAHSPKAPISPSNRYPMIKAEDLARLPGRTPPPQQYHPPVQVAVNGGIDRFAAS